MNSMLRLLPAVDDRAVSQQQFDEDEEAAATSPRARAARTSRLSALGFLRLEDQLRCMSAAPARA